LKEVPIIGVDLAKQVVQLHGATAVEEVVFRKKLSRKQFLAFMQAHRECQFAIEACTTANHSAWTLADLGSDGVFGLRPTSRPGRHKVLRFGLMVERGLYEAATSIREGSAA
jgi:hypothetical protein